MLLTQKSVAGSDPRDLQFTLKSMVSRLAICAAFVTGGAAIAPASAQQATPGSPECLVAGDVVTCEGDISDGFVVNLDPDAAVFNFRNLTAPVAPAGYFGIGITSDSQDVVVNLDSSVVIDVYDDPAIANPAQGLVVLTDGHNLTIDSAAQIRSVTPDMRTAGIEARIYNKDDARLIINNTGDVSVISGGTGERDTTSVAVLAVIENRTGNVTVTNSGNLSSTTDPGSFDTDFIGIAGGIVVNNLGGSGTVDIQNSGAITSVGPTSNGIVGFTNSAAGLAASLVSIDNEGAISLSGTDNYGVLAQSHGADARLEIQNAANITATNASNSNALFALSQTRTGSAEIENRGTITISGNSGRGIGVSSSSAEGAGVRTFTINNFGDMNFTTLQALGITAFARENDDVSIDLYNSGDITATGTTVSASYGISVNFSGSDESDARVTNDASIRFGAGIGAFLTSSNLTFEQTANGTIQMTGAGAQGARLTSIYSLNYLQNGVVSSTGASATGVALVDRTVASGIAASAAYDRLADYSAAISAILNADLIATGTNSDALFVSMGEVYIGAPTAADRELYAGTATIAVNADVTGGSGTGTGVRITGFGTTNLTNNATISAASDNAILGGNGSENIINNGILSGLVSLGAGRDTLRLLAGSSTGRVDLGDGDDELEIRFGAAVPVAAAGGAGADTLVLFAGAAQSGTIDYSTFTGFETGNITGTGEWVLTGSAAAEATAFNVLGGRLTITGDLGGSSADVSSGATLGGTGTLGDVVIENGGILSPGGDTIGTLNMASLFLDAGSVLRFDLGAPDLVGGADNDLLEVAGDLTLDGILNIDAEPAFGEGVYRLVNYGGTLTDNGLSLGVVPVAIYAVQTTVDGQVNLIVGDAASLAIQFWDGNGAAADGAIEGGTGVWNASASNWTNADGSLNAPWASQFAIFQRAGGTVTVEGTQSANGLQFAGDGYTLVAGAGGGLALTGAESQVRVDPGVTATLALPVTAAGDLAKTDAGTLVLSAETDVAGSVLARAGTLRVAGGGSLDAGGNLLVSAPNGTGAIFEATGEGTNATIAGGIVLGGLNAAGRLIVSDGAEMRANTLVATDGSEVEVRGDGAVLSVLSTAVRGIVIGEESTGSLVVSGGGSLASQDTHVGRSAVLVDGAFTPGTGTALVTGAGSTWNARYLAVGNAGGDGLVEIRNGGVLNGEIGSVGSGRIGNADTSRDSSGRVVIDGSGSTWALSDSLEIGWLGEGVVTLMNGGTLSVPEIELGLAGGSGVLNIGAASGQSAGAAGVLNADSISFGDGNGMLVLNHTSNSYDLNAALVGNGLIEQLAGVTRLSGDGSAFTGLTDVRAGTLVVNSDLGGSISVANGAMLAGGGAIGAADISGTLSPGGASSTANMSADSVIFRAGSTFAVDVAANGDGDRLTVAGAADLQGGTVAVTALDPDTAYTDGTVFTILTAGAGVTGTFAGISENSAFLDFILNYSANDVTLETLVIATFPTVAITPNQRSASVGLQDLGQVSGSDSLAVYNTFLAMDAPTAIAAFDSASGEIHASVEYAVNRSSEVFSNILLQRKDGVRGAWATPLGQRGKAKGDGNAAAFDWSSFGIAAGYDAGKATAEGEFTGGVALAYISSDGDADARTSSAEIASWHLGAYGNWTKEALGLTAAASLGRASIDTERSIRAGTLTRTATSSYDADTLALQVEGSYGFTLQSGWTVSPVAILSVGSAKFDSGEEVGADALDLLIDSETFKTLDLGLGAEARKDIGAGTFLARLVVQHAFEDVTPDRDLLLSGSPTRFSIRGPGATRDRLLLGVGYETQLNEKVSLSGRVDSALSDGVSDHAARLAVKWRF